MEKDKYKSVEKVYYIKEDEITSINESLEKIRDFFVYSELIPGLGQIVKKHYIHGTIFLSVFTGYAFYFYKNFRSPPVYNENKVELSKRFGKYYIGEKLVSEEEYKAEINRRKKEKEEYDRFHDKKLKAKVLGVALYAINIADMVFLLMWDSYKEKREKISLRPEISKDFKGLKFRINF